MNAEGMGFRVDERILCNDMQSGKAAYRYRIASNFCGTDSDAMEVESLDIRHLQQSGIALPDMTKRQKESYQSKLARMAPEAPESERWLIGQGFYEIRGTPAYGFGDEVILPDGCGLDVRIVDPVPLKCQPIGRECYRQLITAIPGFSEMLFYYGRLSVLKPMLYHLGLEIPNFLLGVFAPSGYMKTEEVRRRCLNLRDPEALEIRLSEPGIRTASVLDRIKEMRGQTVLLDDFRRRNGRDKDNQQKERLDSVARVISSGVDAANVVVTGEIASLNELGIYSLKDRILSVVVPKATGEELQERKDVNDRMGIRTLADMDKEFVTSIISRFDEFRQDAESFFGGKFLDLARDTETYSRVRRHAAFLVFSEYIFRKYMCQNDPEFSCKQELQSALERSVSMQARRLKKDRLLEDYDYAQLVFQMLEGNYLKKITKKALYSPNGDSFFVNGKYVIIATEALAEGMRRYIGRADISAKDITGKLKEVGVMTKEQRKFGNGSNQTKHWWIHIDTLRSYCERKKQDE